MAEGGCIQEGLESNKNKTKRSFRQILMNSTILEQMFEELMLQTILKILIKQYIKLKLLSENFHLRNLHDFTVLWAVTCQRSC